MKTNRRWREEVVWIGAALTVVAISVYGSETWDAWCRVFWWVLGKQL